MKTDRGSFRMLQHPQLLQERIHDAYRPGRKPAGPACCRRTRERLPGASVVLSGDFFAAHRDEILGRVRNCEQAENCTRYNKEDNLLRVLWCR